MKTLTFALMTLLAAGTLSGCGGGTTASTPITPAPAAVSGVDTPKSVSVVTAN